MRKTRPVLLILMTMLCVLLISASGCGRSEEPAAQVKIGLLLPLSTETGQQARDGAQLALQVLNGEAGTKLQFAAILEDTQGDPTATGTRMEDLCADAAVLGVVGPINSGPATAAAGVANRVGVVLVSPLASTPSLSAPNDYFFRTWPSDATEAQFSARFAFEEMGFRSVAVMNIQAPYGQALAQGFRTTFESLGGVVPEVIEYPQDTQDFAPLAGRLSDLSYGAREKPADAIYYVGYPPDMAELLRNIRSRKITLPILSAAICADPSVATLAGKNAEGLIFPFPTTFGMGGESSQSAQFLSRYQEEYGVAPGFVAAQAYDAAILIGQAVQSANRDGKDLLTRAAVREALGQIHSLDGATGAFQLDANGDAVRDFAMFQIENGAMEPYRAAH